jgi:hypothetical protein
MTINLTGYGYLNVGYLKHFITIHYIELILACFVYLCFLKGKKILEKLFLGLKIFPFLISLYAFINDIPEIFFLIKISPEMNGVY